MKLKLKYNVVYSEEVNSFLEILDEKSRKKILYNISLVAGGVIDNNLFKKLEGTDIWEFRTKYKGKAYRILSFFDTEAEALIITTHGFVKKTQKTPHKEIERANAIRQQYLEQKEEKKR